MKKNTIKTILSLAILSFLFITFAPNEAYAQRRGRVSKSKKYKKIRHNRQYYKKYPRYGSRVRSVPRNYGSISHGKARFRHNNRGVYYRPHRDRYIVTTPPHGMYINSLPHNSYRLTSPGHSNYYYHYGTYYALISSGKYEIIDAPVGAVVNALPRGYKKITVDNIVYYRLDHVFYKAIIQSNGEVAYQVVRS